MLKRINAWDEENRKRVDEWIDGNEICRLCQKDMKYTDDYNNYYYRFVEVHLKNGDVLLHPIADSRKYKDEVIALMNYFGINGDDSFEKVRRSSDNL